MPFPAERTHAGAKIPLHIRDAVGADHDAVRAVTWRAYAEYASTMQPSAWAGLERAVQAGLDAMALADCIVAERAGRIVGSVMLFPPSTDAYAGAAAPSGAPELRLLAVDPAVRGAGVARALVDACVRRARDSGAATLGLHTSASMRSAIALYEDMGFRREPARDFQPEGAELIAAYRLDLR